MHAALAALESPGPDSAAHRQVAAADGGGVADEEAGEAVGEAVAEAEAEGEDATIEERLASQVLLRGCARDSPAPAAGTPGILEYQLHAVR